VQIDCGGSPPKEAVSRSNFFLLPWHVLKGGDSILRCWVDPISGMLVFLERLMIGRWMYLRLFFQVLHSTRVKQGCANRLWWISSKRGRFTVKLLFASLACTEGRRFHWKSVWQTQAPPRTIFCVWSVALGKILTLDNLRR
jgi:hypothetical protein